VSVRVLEHGFGILGSGDKVGFREFFVRFVSVGEGFLHWIVEKHDHFGLDFYGLIVYAGGKWIHIKTKTTYKTNKSQLMLRGRRNRKIVKIQIRDENQAAGYEIVRVVKKG